MFISVYFLNAPQNINNFNQMRFEFSGDYDVDVGQVVRNVL
jgi:hypothetical protein